MNSIQNYIQTVSQGEYKADLRYNETELLSKVTPETPAYTYETTNKVMRIALDIILGILSILFLPYGLYRLMHYLAGKIIVPAQLAEVDRTEVFDDTFTKHLKKKDWL